jgi:AcrR family transcriptional regulator
MIERNSPADAKQRGPAPTKPVDILWAASRLFARQGVASTTTRQIAAEAGTTERTLFKHYGSKDALVQAVLTHAVLAQLAPASLDALRGSIEQAARPGADLQGWHRALLQAREQAMGEAPELTRLLLLELVRDEETRAQFGGQWLATAWEPLLAVLGGLQQAGNLRPDIEPAAMARAFFSLNLGYLIARHVLCPGLAWDDGQERRAIAAIFAEGVLRGRIGPPA